MSDSSDEKIEQLVRSVLTAVDARLDDVRGELRVVAAEAARRHEAVTRQLHDLEERWSTLTNSLSQRDSEPVASRPASLEGTQSRLSALASLPTLLPPPVATLTFAMPLSDTAADVAQAASPAEPVDLTRLADLLSERLGHIGAPLQSNPVA